MKTPRPSQDHHMLKLMWLVAGRIRIWTQAVGPHLHCYPLLLAVGQSTSRKTVCLGLCLGQRPSAWCLYETLTKSKKKNQLVFWDIEKYNIYILNKLDPETVMILRAANRRSAWLNIVGLPACGRKFWFGAHCNTVKAKVFRADSARHPALTQES